MKPALVLGKGVASGSSAPLLSRLPSVLSPFSRGEKGGQWRGIPPLCWEFNYSICLFPWLKTKLEGLCPGAFHRQQCLPWGGEQPDRWQGAVPGTATITSSQRIQPSSP